MCLVAVASGLVPRFPLVIAANRDEFRDRRAAPLSWWVASDGTRLLSGRDLDAGGVWLAASARGRLALVTNVRRAGDHRSEALSRGSLPIQWLTSSAGAVEHWSGVEGEQYNPFNLMLFDLSRGEALWASNRSSPARHLPASGVVGLSNAAMDSPWWKLLTLRERLGIRVRAAGSREALIEAALADLADREPAPDALLPDTGVGIELERLLSSAWIRSPDGRYGTRVSTVVVAEQVGGGAQERMEITVHERSFDGADGPESGSDRRFTFTVAADAARRP